MKQNVQRINMPQSGSAPQRKVTILGSTGSVGQQTVELIEANRDQFSVTALTAQNNVALLAEQIRKLDPDFAVIGDAEKYSALKEAVKSCRTEIAAGKEAIEAAAARDSDMVMAAIVGAAGLPPTFAAVKRGALVAFANKECLVCAGPLMMQHVARHGSRLLPVDSEHNAIFQVFDADSRDSIARLILTASGGPFRTASVEEMRRATPEQAVRHPVWSMGAKISVDSATMMNKGLEIIEARFLFDIPQEQIDVLLHPQSVIHSMVEYRDGSVLAQLGTPDMRTPIAYALAWPKRIATPAEKLDLARIGSLTFEAPDEKRFPALRLARQALGAGGTAPATLNAANEIAVAAFLKGRIGFLDIAKIVEDTLERANNAPLSTLESLIASDTAARAIAEERVRDAGTKGRREG